MGPHIYIESRKVGEQNKAKQLNQVGVVAPMVLQDAQADQTYFKRKVAKLIWPKDEVERIYPVTPDEYEARGENDKLSDDEYVQVKMEQNHVVHLREHASAKESDALIAHIKAHQYMIMQKRLRPDLFPQMPEDQQSQAQQQNPTKQQVLPTQTGPVNTAPKPMQ